MYRIRDFNESQSHCEKNTHTQNWNEMHFLRNLTASSSVHNRIFQSIIYIRKNCQSTIKPLVCSLATVTLTFFSVHQVYFLFILLLLIEWIESVDDHFDLQFARYFFFKYFRRKKDDSHRMIQMFKENNTAISNQVGII